MIERNVSEWKVWYYLKSMQTNIMYDSKNHDDRTEPWRKSETETNSGLYRSARKSGLCWNNRFEAGTPCMQSCILISIDTSIHMMYVFLCAN